MSPQHSQTMTPPAPIGLRGEACVVIAAVLVLPTLLYLGNWAPIGRTLYPACNLALAAYLFSRRSPWFAGHCLLLFCFISLVRRLIDAQAGWDPQNPVLLTPYLCCSLTTISFFNYWLARQPRRLGAFLLMLLCVVYGLILAVFYDRTIAGAADVLKWSVGPLFAVHLMANRADLPQLRSVIESCLIFAGTAMAGYGIIQYVNPPPWDIEWVRGVTEYGMTSVGQPEPFSLRVFSTMNSPGSLGAMMSAGIIVSSKRSLPLAIPTMSLMIVALALSQYRAIWAATALAAIIVIFSRPEVLSPKNILAALAVCAFLCSAALVPEIRDAVTQRASSLAALQGDESLMDRLSQYRALVSDDGLIAGQGLGQAGLVRKLDGFPLAIVDSGLIDIWRAMGVVVGTMFLAAIAWLTVLVFTEKSLDLHNVSFDRAIAVATFVQLPTGSVHIGEVGFCGWLFLGFAIAGLAPVAFAKHLQLRATL
jgi:hypothetical protein